MWRAELSRLIEDRIGLLLSTTARKRLDEVVLKRCRIANLAPERYVARLVDGSDEPELQALIDVATITKTAFFRYPAQIQAIVEELVPPLLARLDPNAPLRIWSAACATGEETYSLAMALHHAGVLTRRRVVILGSDVNQTCLQRARAGQYHLNAATLDCLPAFAREYLIPSGHSFSVADEIRRSVRFDALNLNDSIPLPSGWHVILCCNVLIYFERSNRERIVARLKESMADQGALLFGGAEVVLESDGAFRVVRIGDCFAHVRGSWPGLTPARRAPPTALLQPAPLAVSTQAAQRRIATVPSDLASSGLEGESGRELVDEPPEPSVLPDSASVALSAESRAAPDELLDSLRTRAESRLSSRDHAGAEALLDRALELDPFCARSHFLHGKALNAMGRKDEAEHAFRRVVFLEPESALARYELGLIHHRRGDFASAVRDYDRVLKILEQGSPLASDDWTMSGPFLAHLCRQNRQLARASQEPLDAVADHQRTVAPTGTDSMDEHIAANETHCGERAHRGGQASRNDC